MILCAVEALLPPGWHLFGKGWKRFYFHDWVKTSLWHPMGRDKGCSWTFKNTQINPSTIPTKSYLDQNALIWRESPTVFHTDFSKQCFGKFLPINHGHLSLKSNDHGKAYYAFIFIWWRPKKCGVLFIMKHLWGITCWLGYFFVTGTKIPETHKL